MIDQWRLLNSGHTDGFANMAIDEAILQGILAGKSPQTLRLYGWDPPALSIGYFQSAKKEVNLEHCRKLGVDVVRRPTGGRAVLHEHELTYSVIFYENSPRFPSSLMGAYKLIGEALRSGLAKLGIDGSLLPEAGSVRSKQSSIRSGACFSSPSSYELLADGKKIVGSAQKRIKGGVLQHGSILLKLDREKLFSLLQFNSEESRSQVVNYSYQKMASLAEVSGHSFEYEEVAEAIVEGFEEVLGVVLTHAGLAVEEKRNAEALRVGKYQTADWNFRR